MKKRTGHPIKFSIFSAIGIYFDLYKRDLELTNNDGVLAIINRVQSSNFIQFKRDMFAKFIKQRRKYTIDEDKIKYDKLKRDYIANNNLLSDDKFVVGKYYTIISNEFAKKEDGKYSWTQVGCKERKGQVLRASRVSDQYRYIRYDNNRGCEESSAYFDQLRFATPEEIQSFEELEYEKEILYDMKKQFKWK